MATGATLQTHWKFCNNCFGLFFFGESPQADAGVCPDFPGGHIFINPESGDYALTLSLGGNFESGVRAGQRNWRFCNKCRSLWFNGKPTNGVCAAGDSHTTEGSGDYALVNQGPNFAGDIGLQRDWRFCSDCFVLWFNGKSTNGVCPAGGGHNVSGSGDYALVHDTDSEFN
jgi:hypothetical protein